LWHGTAGAGAAFRIRRILSASRHLCVVFERLALDAGALLRLLVPSRPYLPARHLARLPGEVPGQVWDARLLAVGANPARGFAYQIGGVHCGGILPVLDGEAK
jgi:hypothetical protein